MTSPPFRVPRLRHLGRGDHSSLGDPSGSLPDLLAQVIAARDAVPSAAGLPVSVVWSAVLKSMAVDGLTPYAFDDVLLASSNQTPTPVCSRLDYPSLIPALCTAARVQASLLVGSPPLPGKEAVNAFSFDPVALRTQILGDLGGLQAWRGSILARAENNAAGDPVALSQLRTVIKAFLPVDPAADYGLCGTESGYAVVNSIKDLALEPEAKGFLLPMISPVNLIKGSYYTTGSEYPCMNMDSRLYPSPVNPTWWHPYFATIAKAYDQLHLPQAAQATRALSPQADKVFPVSADVVNGSGIFWEALWTYRNLRDAIRAPLLAAFLGEVTSILAASALRAFRPVLASTGDLTAFLLPLMTGATQSDKAASARVKGAELLAQVGPQTVDQVASKFLATVSGFPTTTLADDAAESGFPALPGVVLDQGPGKPLLTGGGSPLATGHGKPLGMGVKGQGTGTSGHLQVNVAPLGQRLPNGQIIGVFHPTLRPSPQGSTADPVAGTKDPATAPPGQLRWPPGGRLPTSPQPVSVRPLPLTRLPPVPPPAAPPLLVAPPPVTTTAPSGHPAVVAAGIVAGLAALAAGTVALVRVSRGKPALPASLSDPLGK